MPAAESILPVIVCNWSARWDFCVAGKIQGFDENKGIVIVCANCLIRMVNESATAMFGYQQPAELVGKNINCIVPPPFSKNHVSICVLSM